MAKTPQEIVVKINTEVKVDSLPEREVTIQFVAMGSSIAYVRDALTGEMIDGIVEAHISCIAGKQVTAILVREELDDLYNPARRYTEAVTVRDFLG